MTSRLPSAALTISVDLEYDVNQVPSAGQSRLEQLTEGLLGLFARLDMPATWAVADPAVSAARGRLSERPGHELAILGDATWVGREAGRGRFARELARRVTRARQQGLPVETLALRAPLPTDHCDLAIKEGIVAARHASAPRSAARARRWQPQTLRFGLWGFPVGCTLPGVSRWWPGGGGTRAARFAIDEAINQRGLVQLVVDAPALAARGAAAQRVLERVLEHAARRRQHALLEVATIGQTARKLAGARPTQSSRSILRPAA